MKEAKNLIEKFINLEKEIHECFLLEKIKLLNELVDEITKLSIDKMPVARKKTFL